MIVRLGEVEFDDVSYDADADVLYLSRGKPVAAKETIPSTEGHAVRLGGDGDVIGITVVNAKELAERDGRITVTIAEATSLSGRLDASPDDLAAALVS